VTAPSARLSIYVQPGASRTMSAGMHGDSIKIRIAAKPVEDAANLALIEYLAARLGVPRRQVRLVAGSTSRRKVVEIDGVSAAHAAAVLAGPDSGG